jgi:hypothetical protein
MQDSDDDVIVVPCRVSNPVTEDFLQICNSNKNSKSFYKNSTFCVSEVISLVSKTVKETEKAILQYVISFSN